MKRVLTCLVGSLVSLTLIGCAGGGESMPENTGGAPTADADREAVEGLLDRYVQSVNDADVELVRAIWVEGDEVSFVNPGQRVSARTELEGFWQGVLQQAFTTRELTVDDVEVHVAGDAGWAVYDWEFNATQADGQPFQSRGWETQVYRRTDQGWRIVHVHYSVPVEPPAEPAQ